VTYRTAPPCAFQEHEHPQIDDFPICARLDRFMRESTAGVSVALLLLALCALVPLALVDVLSVSPFLFFRALWRQRTLPCARCGLRRDEHALLAPERAP